MDGYLLLNTGQSLTYDRARKDVIVSTDNKSISQRKSVSNSTSKLNEYFLSIMAEKAEIDI